MCDVRVGRKTRYTSQLIHMFLEQTIRFTRRFKGTGHQIPFFTRCGTCPTTRWFGILGLSMWNSPAWKIDAPPQQNANVPQECRTLPGVLKVCIVFDRLYMIPLPCRTHVYSLEICMLLYLAFWKYFLCLIGSLYMHSIDLCVMEAKVDIRLC